MRYYIFYDCPLISGFARTHSSQCKTCFFSLSLNTYRQCEKGCWFEEEGGLLVNAIFHVVVLFFIIVVDHECDFRLDGCNVV